MVRNELNDDTLTFTTGVVWQRFPFTYTFETALSDHWRAFGDIDEELITVRPGVVWRVPQKYTFDSKPSGSSVSACAGNMDQKARISGSRPA